MHARIPKQLVVRYAHGVSHTDRKASAGMPVLPTAKGSSEAKIQWTPGAAAHLGSHNNTRVASVSQQNCLRHPSLAHTRCAVVQKLTYVVVEYGLPAGQLGIKRRQQPARHLRMNRSGRMQRSVMDYCQHTYSSSSSSTENIGVSIGGGGGKRPTAIAHSSRYAHAACH